MGGVMADLRQLSIVTGPTWQCSVEGESGRCHLEGSSGLQPQRLQQAGRQCAEWWGAPLVVSAMNVVLDVVTMPMTPDQQW